MWQQRRKEKLEAAADVNLGDDSGYSDKRSSSTSKRMHPSSSSAASHNSKWNAELLKYEESLGEERY